MSLLAQRVSGALHGQLYYPHAAGVGLSFNPYVWNREIDPQSGMLRLVFGLGTRAVDRADDDYTRVVALNAPTRRPEASFDEVRRYTQRQVDTLDLAANRLISSDFVDVANVSPDVPLDMVASRDQDLERLGAETGRSDLFPWILTFDKLLSQTPFPADMREMLKTLEKSYGSPVDVEFTLNFSNRCDYKINLVQCRPLQVAREDVEVALPTQLLDANTVMTARGAVIGHGRATSVDRIIQVVAAEYGQMPIRERYAVARLIGRLMHLEEDGQKKLLLIGPGRWGTSTPSLGVPISFAEINTCSVLCEVVAMREDLVPDVSLGTHFFNELVECDILYLALFPGREGNLLNEDLLQRLPNRLVDLIPSAASRQNVVRVIDSADLGEGKSFRLHANNLTQDVACYIDDAP
jgi:hypothetical protein